MSTYLIHLLLSLPQDVYQQILHALMEWRGADCSDSDAQDKVQLLFDVLSDEDIGRVDLVEQLKEYYNIT